MSKWTDPSPQLIQRYRILKGYTLKEAAEKAKVDAAQISNWENGKHKPASKSLNKLATAYDRDVSDFYEVDIKTVKTEATAVVMEYLRSPDANFDRKAQIASHLLVQLPETKADNEDDPDNWLDDDVP